MSNDEKGPIIDVELVSKVKIGKTEYANIQVYLISSQCNQWFVELHLFPFHIKFQSIWGHYGEVTVGFWKAHCSVGLGID
jgi:hypothetical protein|tara:strand:- start:1600 stop:1839 length:240 start_codon:yes stop_codon:yes gene_type:complete